MTPVKIYQPARNAMQSGRGKSAQWILEYIPTSGRVPEALMGWVSSADTLNQVKIKFDSQKDAVKFAKENNFEYTISTANQRRVKPRNYGDNFKYIPVEEGA
ncbi:MAG: ETC complex I subunit [Alphaproteobacteria bacterium]